MYHVSAGERLPQVVILMWARLTSLQSTALLPNSQQIAPEARPEYSSGKQRY